MKYYVEVKVKRYTIHPNEDIILERITPRFLRTQFQVMIETKKDETKTLLSNDWKN